MTLPADTEPSAEELWHDLLEKDDRTSPEEYPDMALITRDEFFAALDRFQAAAGVREEAAKDLYNILLAIVDDDTTPMRADYYDIAKRALKSFEETP